MAWASTCDAGRGPPINPNFNQDEHGWDDGSRHAGASHYAAAVVGMGGVGKTILAVQVWDDPAIVTRFSNRRFWVVLGKAPDVLSKLHSLLVDIAAVQGESAADVVAPVAAADGTRALIAALTRFKGEPVYITLDDVDKREDALAFLVGLHRQPAANPPLRIVYLVTSRCRSVVNTGLNIKQAWTAELDLPSLPAALDLLWSAARLLHSRVDRVLAFRDACTPAATRLLQSRALLPNSLCFIGAMLPAWPCFQSRNATKTSAKLLGLVNSIDRSVPCVQVDAQLLFDSLGRMPPHLDARQRYQRLSVFPEDCFITPAMMATSAATSRSPT